MNHIKEFLDTSTIHGMSWISVSNGFSRILWINIVIGGFSGAGFLIYESFKSWADSPISTTIETLPISQITFPNVTVCPPRNSFLNLNYDILQSENVTVNADIRKELFEYALNIIQNDFYDEIIANLTKIQDPNRHFNWYHGYSKIVFPYHNSKFNQLSYYIFTNARSGNISTQYFGDRFRAEKVDGHMDIMISINSEGKLYKNL